MNYKSNKYTTQVKSCYKTHTHFYRKAKLYVVKLSMLLLWSAKCQSRKMVNSFNHLSKKHFHFLLNSLELFKKKTTNFKDIKMSAA